jgi:hypothetical protein
MYKAFNRRTMDSSASDVRVAVVELRLVADRKWGKGSRIVASQPLRALAPSGDPLPLMVLVAASIHPPRIVFHA